MEGKIVWLVLPACKEEEARGTKRQARKNRMIAYHLSSLHHKFSTSR